MLTYEETLTTAKEDGPTLTSAAAALCLPSEAVFPLPPGFFDYVGKAIEIEAWGRISCVITTPGTARFDVRFGSTVVADGLALPLNIVAKVNVGWYLKFLLTARALGTNGNLWVQGKFESEAIIGTPLPSVGPSGLITLPYNTAPVVGANFDTQASQAVSMFFTQTVGTGSLTLHQYKLRRLN